ncbi:hypothetical protein MAR_002070 [Mya arenaria]|uniref:Uncharacterized protein n=1 Tax=Mya arenaria TaxID=6604 RepID=A0ABY7FGS9_MYAAR|nr:hypothetical protein MAR_002070 [Mya arenaria]
MENTSERKIEKSKKNASYFKIYLKDVEVRDLRNNLKYMKSIIDRIAKDVHSNDLSYEQFVVDETFGIELVRVQDVAGSGYNIKSCVDITSTLERNKTRALVTAIARIESHPQWNSIRLGRDIQRQLAINLHEKAVVP